MSQSPFVPPEMLMFQKGELVLLIKPFDRKSFKSLSEEFFVSGSLLQVVDCVKHSPFVAVTTCLNSDFDLHPEKYVPFLRSGHITLAYKSNVLKFS
jgi:hypothetical protein